MDWRDWREREKGKKETKRGKMEGGRTQVLGDPPDIRYAREVIAWVHFKYLCTWLSAV